VPTPTSLLAEADGARRAAPLRKVFLDFQAQQTMAAAGEAIIGRELATPSFPRRIRPPAAGCVKSVRVDKCANRARRHPRAQLSAEGRRGQRQTAPWLGYASAALHRIRAGVQRHRMPCRRDDPLASERARR
jgi:hypothetical protein